MNDFKIVKNIKLFIYSLSEQNTIVNYDSETDKFSTFFY